MGYHFVNESKWIGDIKAGSKEAFKYAFNYFFTNLCAYTTNLTQDPDLAQDIVQEIFITLWNNRKRILITTSLKSYLYKACYHKYIDIFRKEKNIHKKLEEFRYIKLLDLEEEDASMRNEKMERLKNLIQELPPKCKEVFMLSKYDGLKYQEIADQLDISIKTVENQISKAYSVLRKGMSQDHK